MSELRAPDPTLFDHHAAVYVTRERRRYFGHRHEHCVGGGHFLAPEAAAYIAVPCRECFPDAPEPGHAVIRVHADGEGFDQQPSDHLAWQTEGADRG